MPQTGPDSFFARVRYYVLEPNPYWNNNSIGNSLLFLLFCACMTLVILIAFAFRFAHGLLFIAPFLALLGLFSAIFPLYRLLIWWPFWYLRTIGTRARYRSRLRVQSWPRVLISPHLASFPRRSWDNLPVYEEFLATPWLALEDHSLPLRLHAALQLATELAEAEREFDGMPVATQKLYDFYSRVA